MKNKFKSIAVILIALTIGLTSCSKQYNLALVKRNNNSESVVSQVKIIKPIPVIENNVIKTAIESNENLTTKTFSSNPVIATQSNNEIATSSIAKDETGIDKNLYSEDAKFKSYLPVFSSEFTNQSSNSNHESDHGDLILLVILAILIPPLAVYLYQGSITSDFWIDLILTLCFDLPGILFALYIILR